MNRKSYTALLIFIASIGGLLYGYDIGVIGKALPYMGLDETQKGMIASAIMFGAPLAGIVAGAMSDWLGRKRAMIISSLIFVASVAMIVYAGNFTVLFAGRMLQGLSAGMIAVVLPVYMSESTPAKIRGISSTMFQLCITIGISTSMIIGYYYQVGVDQQAGHLAGNQEAITAVYDQAWRDMFRSSGYPALVFILVALFAAESPRWLFRHGKRDRAEEVLAMTRGAEEVRLEMSEMEEIQSAAHQARKDRTDSLFQRRYMIPLFLSVFLLSVNQATGICAVLSFVETIATETGLTTDLVKTAGIWLTACNVIATVFGVLMVDVLGRKMLLKIGTGLIVLALAVSIGIYAQVDSKRVDARDVLTGMIRDGRITTSIQELAGKAGLDSAAPAQVSVQYSVDGVEKEVLVKRGDAADGGILEINRSGKADSRIEIVRAKISPAPSTAIGMGVFICFVVYMLGFAFGPGVVLWLMSAELMPTRVRSVGMGIGVLGNALVTAATTYYFLPVVGQWGYTAMFGIWLGFTLVYLIFAAFILPETKGKTLEEIEAHFAK